MAPDLVIRGGFIVDGTGAPGRTGDLAVSGGRIAAVGPSWDAADWMARAGRVIDVGDATVTPGLIDAHIHPILGA